MNLVIREILLDIAKEFNISFEEAKQIYETQFIAIREIMKEGEHDKPETFKNINVMKLGKIYVNPKKIEIIKQKKNGTFQKKETSNSSADS